MWSFGDNFCVVPIFSQICMDHVGVCQLVTFLWKINKFTSCDVWLLLPSCIRRLSHNSAILCVSLKIL
jgi:hypothetical protein